MRNGSRRKMSPNRLLAKHFPDLGGLIGNRPERRKAALRQSSMLSSRLSVEALEPRLLLSADVPPVGVSDTPDPMETIFGEFTRSEENTSELQSLMSISYAVFCLKKKKTSPNVAE